jgi:hypothetical protein
LQGTIPAFGDVIVFGKIRPAGFDIRQLIIYEEAVI